MRTRGWMLAGAYVAAVAALAASAFWTPGEEFSWNREGVAMLLTLPALIAALPVVYAVGAAVWGLTGAADGNGPMWPVTLTYALLFAGVAVANVCLLLLLWRRRRRQATVAPLGGH